MKRLDDFPPFLNIVDETVADVVDRKSGKPYSHSVNVAITVIVLWQMLQFKTNPKRPNYVASVLIRCPLPGSSHHAAKRVGGDLFLYRWGSNVSTRLCFREICRHHMQFFCMCGLCLMHFRVFPPMMGCIYGWTVKNANHITERSMLCSVVMISI